MVRTKRLLTHGMVVLSLVLILLPGPAIAKTEIQWWHANTGFLGERVNEIVAKYNASQNDYEIKAVYKGSYPETLTAGIAAYRAKTQPHLLQVFEVGTQTMLSWGAIYPVLYQLVDEGSGDQDRLGRFPQRCTLPLSQKGELYSDALQLLDGDPLLQPDDLQEGRPQSRQGARHVRGDREGGQDGRGFRSDQSRFHCLMALVDPG